VGKSSTQISHGKLLIWGISIGAKIIAPAKDVLEESVEGLKKDGSRGKEKFERLV